MLSEYDQKTHGNLVPVCLLPVAVAEIFRACLKLQPLLSWVTGTGKSYPGVRFAAGKKVVIGTATLDAAAVHMQ